MGPHSQSLTLYARIQFMTPSILLIEDEPLIQIAIKKLLEAKGALVDCTSYGKEAIDLIHINRYDTIICDLMLKDITGFEVIEESKKIFNEEEIKNKFIIITAYSGSHILDKASHYKCKLINKPFDENIDSVIDTFLRIQ